MRGYRAPALACRWANSLPVIHDLNAKATSVKPTYVGSLFSPITWRWPSNLRLHPVVWAFALVVAVMSWVYLPEGGNDWRNDIGPSARQWWPAPWQEGLPLLPWAAMVLSPLGGLPDRLATALTNGASVIILALVVRYFGGHDWIAVVLLVTPSGYWLFKNGQTDCLILGGLLFFNGLDPLILVLKPQVAIGAIISRLRRAGNDGIGYLSPLVIVVILSLVVWWAWPLGLLKYAPILIPSEWNSSAWPYSIPIGLSLLWYAWKTGDDRWGVAASPLLFPYVNLPSYLGLLAILAARWPRWTIVILVVVYLVFGLIFIASR